MARSRTALFWIFLLSAIWESVITVTLFVSPGFEGAQYHSANTPETAFFSNILGGFMVLFTALCWLCTFQIQRRDAHAWDLGTIIGIFWVYMGIGLYVHPGAPSYVILDALRGCVILLLVYLAKGDQRLFESLRSPLARPTD